MRKILTVIAIITSSFTFSQVGIGTTTPSEKSILDLTAIDKGFLLPRMTTAQRMAIAPNATTDRGLQVYDIDKASIWYWNGTTWLQQGAKNIYDTDGDIAPTTSINRKINFTNGGSLSFDANTLFVDATNNKVGIGTLSPSATLDVNGSLKINNVPTTINSQQDILSVDTNGNVQKRAVDIIRGSGVNLNSTFAIPLGSLITGSFINNVCNDGTLARSFTGFCILNFDGTFTSLHTDGGGSGIVTVTGNNTSTIRFSYNNGCAGAFMSFIQFSYGGGNLTVTSDNLGNYPTATYIIR